MTKDKIRLVNRLIRENRVEEAIKAIEHGAKVNVRDENGMTALDWVYLEPKCFELIRYLIRSSGAKRQKR